VKTNYHVANEEVQFSIPHKAQRAEKREQRKFHNQYRTKTETFLEYSNSAKQQRQVSLRRRERKRRNATFDKTQEQLKFVEE
jgi:hypothetical protein